MLRYGKRVSFAAVLAMGLCGCGRGAKDAKGSDKEAEMAKRWLKKVGAVE